MRPSGIGDLLFGVLFTFIACLLAGLIYEGTFVEFTRSAEVGERFLATCLFLAGGAAVIMAVLSFRGVLTRSNSKSPSDRLLD